MGDNGTKSEDVDGNELDGDKLDSWMSRALVSAPTACFAPV